MSHIRHKGDLKLTYFSDVSEAGKLQKNITQRIQEDLRLFTGRRVEITLCRKKSKRSAKQNKLWWVYMTILGNEIGYSKEEMHSVVGLALLQEDVVDEQTGEVLCDKQGRPLRKIRSTTSYGKGEFADKVTELQRWAAENFNVTLPSPDEQTNMELNTGY